MNNLDVLWMEPSALWASETLRSRLAIRLTAERMQAMFKPFWACEMLLSIIWCEQVSRRLDDKLWRTDQGRILYPIHDRVDNLLSGSGVATQHKRLCPFANRVTKRTEFGSDAMRVGIAISSNEACQCD